MLERPQSRVENPRSEWRLTARAPIAITDFTDGRVPPRGDVRVNPGMYESLGKAQLSVFLATNPDGEQETIIVGPSLPALKVNGLMYYASPYKGYGFDAKDLIGDWGKKGLYNPDSEEQKDRKIAHGTMPGWNHFEASRELILGVLTRSYDEWDYEIHVNDDENDVIVPVLRWKTDAEGNNRILLEPLDEKLKAALKEELPEQIKDTGRLDGGMGLLYLAAYSPQQTEWPSIDGYSREEAFFRQAIGPAQVLAYAYREVAKAQKDPAKVRDERDLQKSPLLTGLGQYSRTGEVSTIEIVEVKKPESWAVQQARFQLSYHPRFVLEPVLNELLTEGVDLPNDPDRLINMVMRIYFDRRDNERKIN